MPYDCKAPYRNCNAHARETLLLMGKGEQCQRAKALVSPVYTDFALFGQDGITHARCGQEVPADNLPCSAGDGLLRAGLTAETVARG